MQSHLLHWDPPILVSLPTSTLFSSSVNLIILDSPCKWVFHPVCLPLNPLSLNVFLSFQHLWMHAEMYQKEDHDFKSSTSPWKHMSHLLLWTIYLFKFAYWVSLKYVPSLTYGGISDLLTSKQQNKVGPLSEQQWNKIQFPDERLISGSYLNKSALKDIWKPLKVFNID